MEKSGSVLFVTGKPSTQRWPIVPKLIVILTAAAFTWMFWTKGTAKPDFSHLAGHCSVPQLPDSIYAERLSRLGETLTALNASAYIAEPGSNALYYANLSTSQWWLSERPLLLVVTPEPRVTIITPKFEATRAKLLYIPLDNISYIEWAEADNPYEATLKALPSDLKGSKIMVDEGARFFIPTGLQATRPDAEVVIASKEIKSLRERKTHEEIETLKCVNELTLLAIREVRKHLYFGMKESEGLQLLKTALGQAGLTNLDTLLLFGENAALPHGSGTDRVLTPSDLVLIDCGGNLNGYQSDVTRTFALPGSQIPPEHLEIWHTVQTAQRKALEAVRAGTPAKDIDVAARSYIEKLGYGRYFTTRVGHGIGLEVHESPYLVSSNEQPLETGNTFSDEPGIYIEGQIGVRLEDCFYVEESGGVPLTSGVGGLTAGPWDP